MQDNVKTLQGEAGKLQDSETMRRMKEAYERARITTSIKENPRLMKAAQQLKEGGGKVSDAVGYTLKQMEESEIGRAVSNQIELWLDIHIAFCLEVLEGAKVVRLWGRNG